MTATPDQVSPVDLPITASTAASLKLRPFAGCPDTNAPLATVTSSSMVPVSVASAEAGWAPVNIRITPLRKMSLPDPPRQLAREMGMAVAASAAREPAGTSIFAADTDSISSES
ncbi:MAG: hypothetical protein ACK5PS_08945 [Desulfopila sp.]